MHSHEIALEVYRQQINDLIKHKRQCQFITPVRLNMVSVALHQIALRLGNQLINWGYKLQHYGNLTQQIQKGVKNASVNSNLSRL